MSFKELDCSVDSGEDLFGQFANALRLTLDGSEALLDFCVYSEAEDCAKVVSRVRVSVDFLPVISEKINSSLVPPKGSMFFITKKSPSVA